jgi:hypothetical protein
METTQQKTEQGKPTLEMSLASMRIIDDRIRQWNMLEEEWPRNNIDRKQQTDYAKALYGEIRREIDAAYRTCPHCSDV